MNRLLLSVAATATCSLLSAQLSAQDSCPDCGLVVPMSFSDIVKQSEVIAVGTAADVQSRYGPAKATIQTFVTFRDVSLRKGRVEGQLTLRFEGGAIGEDRLLVPGMPIPKKGTRYLMFIKGNGKHLSPIAGYNQGIFAIVKSDGREVLRNFHGLELIGIENDRFVFAGKPQPVTPAKAEAPEVIPVPDHEVKPAHPDADRLETEALRRIAREASRDRGPAAVPADGPGDFSQGDVKPAPPPHSHTGPVNFKNFSPIIIAAKNDLGARLSVGMVLSRTERVR